MVAGDIFEDVLGFRNRSNALKDFASNCSTFVKVQDLNRSDGLDDLEWKLSKSWYGAWTSSRSVDVSMMSGMVYH